MASILTGISMTALTSVILQRPPIRRVLGIPALPANPPRLPTLRESRTAFYKMLDEQQKAAQAEIEKSRGAGKKGGRL